MKNLWISIRNIGIKNIGCDETNVLHLLHEVMQIDIYPTHAKRRVGLSNWFMSVRLSVRPSVLSVYDRGMTYLNWMLYFEHKSEWWSERQVFHFTILWPWIHPDRNVLCREQWGDFFLLCLPGSQTKLKIIPNITTPIGQIIIKRPLLVYNVITDRYFLT